MNPPSILPNHQYTFHLEIPIERLIDFYEHRRLSLYVYKGTVCENCGIDCNRLIYGLDRRNNMHLDLYDQDLTRMMTVGHIIPKSRGGTMDMNNLRPLCHVCNSNEGISIRRLCESEELSKIHLIGKKVTRRSGYPFKNGEKVNTIAKVFLFEGKYKFSLEEGGTYEAEKVNFVRQK